jgi:transcriptional regulator with XRE-family HTH domain
LAKTGGARTRGKDRSTLADQFIGMRIRERRIIHGVSQQRLGDLVGATHQQVNKHEHGISGVSVGRLYEIGQELSTPLEYFVGGSNRTRGNRLAASACCSTSRVILARLRMRSI